VDTTFSTNDFELIVCEHQPGLLAFSRRLVHSREDAEDVVQETFLRAYRSLRAMSTERRSKLRFRPWLYTIARNTAWNFLSKRRLTCVSLSHYEGVAVELPQLVEPDTPETILADFLSREAVEAALSRLPRHLRDAAHLRYVKGLSQPEIARAFGQPIGTVKSHLSRALHRIRRAFETAA